MANTMKVRVTLTIEVDREAWDSTYGNGESAADVRADVRSYALNHLREGSAAADEGAILDVRIG